MESVGKYVVYKREDFDQHINRGIPPMTAQMYEVPDAVVIRRQDIFASPALAGYAASIAIAAKLTNNEEDRKRLLQLADFFEEQARLAADEGYKIPD